MCLSCLYASFYSPTDVICHSHVVKERLIQHVCKWVIIFIWHPFILIPGLIFYRNYMIWVSFCSSKCWLRAWRAFFIEFGLWLLWYRRKWRCWPLQLNFLTKKVFTADHFLVDFFYIKNFWLCLFYRRGSCAPLLLNFFFFFAWAFRKNGCRQKNVPFFSNVPFPNQFFGSNFWDREFLIAFLNRRGNDMVLLVYI